MNWTEGSLSRHTRGRGRTDDRPRQRRFLAQARNAKTRDGSGAGAGDAVAIPASTPESPPFFQVSMFTKDPAQSRAPRKSVEVAESGSPRGIKRDAQSIGVIAPKRKRRTPKHSDDDDLETKRRRLLARPDWAGITLQKPLQLSQPVPKPVKITRPAKQLQQHPEVSVTVVPAQLSSHFNPMTSPANPARHLRHNHPTASSPSPVAVARAVRGAPSPRLHHPKPIRRTGDRIVESLESVCPMGRPGPGSIGTESVADTDNLLPLSDTLPDISLRLDFLEDPGLVLGKGRADSVLGALTAAADCGAKGAAGPYSGAVSPGGVTIEPARGGSPGVWCLDSDDVSLTALLPESSSSFSDGGPRDPSGSGASNPIVIPSTSGLSRAGLRATRSLYHDDARGYALTGTRQGRPATGDSRASTGGSGGVGAGFGMKEGTSKMSQDEEDALWMEFIFDDDSDDGEIVRRSAFEEARRDTARILVPSLPSLPSSNEAAAGSTSPSRETESDAGATCGSPGPRMS